MGRKFVDGEKRNIQTLPVPSLLSADDHGDDGGIASEDDKDESNNNKKDQELQGKGSSNKMWLPQGSVTFQLWRRPVRGGRI